ncbi:MAG: endolytic transglycosylase MltG [Pseudomonadota bacterium]
MKKALGVLLGLALVTATCVGGYLWWLNERVTAFAAAPHGSGKRTVEIPQGSGPRALAQLVAREGIVSNGELFFLYLRRDKLAPKLKAGEYEFDLPVTPAQVVEKLASGQVKLYRFTIPEGLRVDEILPLLARAELPLKLERLERLSRDRAFLKKAGVSGLEGYLYPDTYSFSRHADEEAVLLKMVARAKEEFRRAEPRRKPGNTLDELQVMTLASIVEKETGAPEERPRISCVFHNRLRLGMKLQTDPTVLYAAMLLRGGAFVKNITRRDLEAVHPYNTYTTPGLPPGPIASPGAAAIRAALEPLECGDLFFVSRNDGTHVFCPDLQCHNAAVEEWQRRYFRNKRAAEKDAAP